MSQQWRLGWKWEGHCMLWTLLWCKWLLRWAKTKAWREWAACPQQETVPGKRRERRGPMSTKESTIQLRVSHHWNSVSSKWLHLDSENFEKASSSFSSEIQGGELKPSFMTSNCARFSTEIEHQQWNPEAGMLGREQARRLACLNFNDETQKVVHQTLPPGAAAGNASHCRAVKWTMATILPTSSNFWSWKLWWVRPNKQDSQEHVAPSFFSLPSAFSWPLQIGGILVWCTWIGLLGCIVTTCECQRELSAWADPWCKSSWWSLLMQAQKERRNVCGLATSQMCTHTHTHTHTLLSTVNSESLPCSQPNHCHLRCDAMRKCRAMIVGLRGSQSWS